MYNQSAQLKTGGEKEEDCDITTGSIDIKHEKEIRNWLIGLPP